MKKLLLLLLVAFIYINKVSAQMPQQQPYGIMTCHKTVIGQKSDLYQNSDLFWFVLDQGLSKKSIFLEWRMPFPTIFVMGIECYDRSGNLLYKGNKGPANTKYATSIYLGLMPNIEKYDIINVRWTTDMKIKIIMKNKFIKP